MYHVSKCMKTADAEQSGDQKPGQISENQKLGQKPGDRRSGPVKDLVNKSLVACV